MLIVYESPIHHLLELHKQSAISHVYAESLDQYNELLGEAIAMSRRLSSVVVNHSKPDKWFSVNGIVIYP